MHCKSKRDYESQFVERVDRSILFQCACPEKNTVKQILKEYAEDIGISLTRYVPWFRNKRTGREVVDANTTVQELGLVKGDSLCFIFGAGGVV